MGSFDPWRSVDLIVEAFKIARKKKKMKLVLIGGGGNIDDIKEMTKDDKDIVVTDWIKENKDVIAYCKGSDVLMMTPRKNTMAKTVSSIKCFEYIACEVPSILTNTGEHEELVRKLDVGLVAEADPKSIADSIIEMIKNKKQYKNFKKNCKKHKNDVDFKNTRRNFSEEIQNDLG